ncbi:MAG: hypothetical protein FWG38_01415 [Defluviitaleaceae bacterium]|nr:hypothetical protein [Defluviitaleaceae bacterium]
MEAHTYTDFIKTLDASSKPVADAICDHMTAHYPDYKPYNIRPMNKAADKWQMNFRKKPEFGKAFCTLYSVRGKLSMRVVGAGFMPYELFLRQHEFGEKVRHYFFAYGFCGNCGKKCHQQYREYWYVNGELLTTGCMRHKTAADYIGVVDDYAAINDLQVADIPDLLHLLGIQAKYMAMPKNAKEVRGGDYGEVSKKRCGDVDIITLTETALDIDEFDVSDYSNAKRLDKYAAEYSLTPMGAHDGLWFYHDPGAVCGVVGNDYSHTTMPAGQYAAVTISDPLSFSAWRVWTYIAGWMREHDVCIRPVNIGGVNAPYFVKFYRQHGGEYMSVYVPVE